MNEKQNNELAVSLAKKVIEVLDEKCRKGCTLAHRYSDLPMKGLGKSMESVGIDEPVIIPQSAALEGVIWGYTKAEIERRAYELKAAIKWMELPPQNTADEQRFQMWFSNVV